MYNKSPRGRLVDPAFTPLGGIASRLLQRSLQAGLRLPGGPKPTPDLLHGGISRLDAPSGAITGSTSGVVTGFCRDVACNVSKTKARCFPRLAVMFTRSAKAGRACSAG